MIGAVFMPVPTCDKAFILMLLHVQLRRHGKCRECSLVAIRRTVAQVRVAAILVSAV